VCDSRAAATEFLDRPDCDPALAAASYRYMETVNLRRSRLASLAVRLLLAGSGAPARVRHDALLSVRRGFSINELSTLLRQLDGVTVSVEPARWCRIAAIIRFKPGENS